MGVAIRDHLNSPLEGASLFLGFAWDEAVKAFYEKDFECLGIFEDVSFVGSEEDPKTWGLKIGRGVNKLG